jgi:hypothetical protein
MLQFTYLSPQKYCNSIAIVRVLRGGKFRRCCGHGSTIVSGIGAIYKGGKYVLLLLSVLPFLLPQCNIKVLSRFCDSHKKME